MYGRGNAGVGFRCLQRDCLAARPRALTLTGPGKLGRVAARRLAIDVNPDDEGT